MMNIEVLDEQLFNCCWLNCSMPLVDSISVSRFFLKLNLYGIEFISNPKLFG